MPSTATALATLHRSHRITASPRFRTERGALWLGLGLCFATLWVLHRADPR
jgi:hypothetical protein